MATMPIALVSVSEKSGVETFARDLILLGWDIVASEGTARYLFSRGVVVRDIASFAGGSPILGHKVVTLSREIHAGLLASDTAEEQAELKRLGLPRIDLVCVDLYPLEREIAKKESGKESVRSATDVGGIALLHAAAKGRRIVIAHAADREVVVQWLREGKPCEEEFLTELAARAEAIVAQYVLASARYQSGGRYNGFVAGMMARCAYGENGHQEGAALFSYGSADPLALDSFHLLRGTLPSYNNYADLDRLLQTMTHIAAVFDENRTPVLPGASLLSRPYIAIGGKHGNVCGASIGYDARRVLEAMLAGDLRAIFGGAVMVNFSIQSALADVLLHHAMGDGKRLLDLVSAPAFDEIALEKLGSRKGSKCRLFANQTLEALRREHLDASPRFRLVRGGFLHQPNYTFVPSLRDHVLEKIGEASIVEQHDMLLAWAIGATSNSNTVTIVKDRMLLGNGVGQQDRVGACELALKRAHDGGHSTIGAVAYSDSFFPFVDGPLALANAGIRAIFATSGSVRDRDVAELCARRGVALYRLPDASARGFFGH